MDASAPAASVTRMEIQQSSAYAQYIRSLGWIVERVDGVFVYIKPFPLIGGLAKIQRGKTLPSPQALVPVLRSHGVRKLAVEPDASVKQPVFDAWIRTVRTFVAINTDYFLPTKTIRVNLSPSEESLFKTLSEAKRRAVRRAEKNHIRVYASADIDAFIRLKSRSAGLLGFITTAGVRQLWNILPEKNKCILFADHGNTHVAGILLLFWSGTAYYWIAGATKQGKKLFAPTSLVWQAIRESKRRNMRYLDFVGVWDERIPHKNHEWKGFTKFKEGFGGAALYYPIAGRG